MWLLVVLIGWPLVEIALFVTLGAVIGLWPTLAIVVGTGFLGVTILRRRGLRSLGQLRQSVTLQPHQPLGDGLLTMLAALLLILPGFLTDFFGLLLLIPPVRRFVVHRIGVELRAASVNLMGSLAANRMAHPRPAAAEPVGPEINGPVIDGEFHEVEDVKRPTHPPSGWTRH